MKSNFLRFGRLLPLIFMFLIYACSNNDDNGGQGTTDDAPAGEDPLPNIIALAETVNVLEDFVEALNTADADLVNTLSNEGSFTVFAPSNDAFMALLSELEGFDDLSDFDEAAEQELLAEILRYHVVEGFAAFSEALTEGTTLTTLQGEDLGFVVDGTVFVTDATDVNAEVVGADNEASNGVVHIVDKILLPQAVLDQLFPRPLVGELIAETESLSLLNQALEAANLVQDLNGEGPFTVFAPTNAAIEALFDQLGEDFASLEDFDNPVEIAILRNLLLYHVVGDNIGSADLQAGTVPTLLMDESLEIIPSGDSFVVGDASEEDANFVEVDNEASNGVVHIVDKILIPQFVIDFLNDSTPPPASVTIAQLVRESDDFSQLREALELTGLLDVLDEEGPFTVFAPSNNSFNQLLLLMGVGFNGLEDFDTQVEIDFLRNVLAYHVLPTSLASDEFAAQNFETLANGDQLRLESRNGEFVVLDLTGLPANFVANDFQADNGIIHVIDRILLSPSALDILIDIAEDSIVTLLMELDTDLDLQDLVYIAVTFVNQLGDALQEDFTLFLPTAQAFNDLFESLSYINELEDFLDEETIDILITILEYHCVPGTRLTSADLSDGLVFGTFQGEDVEVDLDSGNVLLLDATGEPSRVVNADNLILNGVVHVIDRVLLPQEVLNEL